jgi:DNA topoisomerase-1
MKSLVIVESYTKSKTIQKYLGEDFIVSYSSGHIYNLPKETLGFNTDDWKPTYISINTKIISKLRDYVKQCDKIYLAADPDIEGEAIAYHVKCALKDLLKGKECHRIKFNEITKPIILDAITNPINVDMNIVKAQETRRIVDRLIGYRISPILWSKFNNNYLSAGRVQLASLLICINQMNKIIKKELSPLWNISCKMKMKSMPLIQANMYRNNELFKTENDDEVITIMNSLNIDDKYKIEFTKKESKTYPSAPYTTTTMQQDAYNTHKITSKKTMQLAQDLYENGLITYMRTDSTNISGDAKNLILNYIKKTYGEDNAKYRTFKTKVVNAQEAHEAIRVTNPSNTDISNAFTNITPYHIKLYNLIWKRCISCLMADAEYMDINITFKKTEEFKSTKSFLTKLGYLLVLSPDKKIEDFKNFVEDIENNKIAIAKEFLSKPEISNIPSMFNEVALIKKLEKEGIGRPSTYAATIEKILTKKYVELGSNPHQILELNEYIKKNTAIDKNIIKINIGGKEKDLLIPTEIGILICDYLKVISPYLCDLKFTALMENELDEIMTGANNIEILNNLNDKINNTITISANDNKSFATTTISSGIPGSSMSPIINTKYGYCYYHTDTKKYTNIESYLTWKKIKADKLEKRDIDFLASLPKKIVIDNKTLYINIGKYGLYLKDESNNNIKLDKKKWGDYI